MRYLADLAGRFAQRINVRIDRRSGFAGPRVFRVIRCIRPAPDLVGCRAALDVGSQSVVSRCTSGGDHNRGGSGMGQCDLSINDIGKFPAFACRRRCLHRGLHSALAASVAVLSG